MLRSLTLLSLAACSPVYLAPNAGEEGDRADVPGGLEVLFCPHDDTVTPEVAEIQRVVDERRADPATYADGENPYVVRYAVYNLRNPPIVYALADAADAGVDVQILIDADQLDPARDWNWADDYLRDERGFSYADDHRALSTADRLTTDIVGIDGAGLMHLKARLFETPTARTLITGSMNPGDDAVLNDENWNLVVDERIVARYDELYDAILLGKPIVNTWDEGAGLNVLSNPEASGPDAGAKILSWLKEEDEQILLMVFSVRDLTAPGVSGSLVSILTDKVAQGVPVVLITDRKQSDGYYDTTEDKLRKAGVRVYEATNTSTEFTAMHHKVAVLGRTDLRVITDAANWSKAGLGSASSPAENQETTLFYESSYDGGRFGRRYLAAFVETLETYAWDSAGVDKEPTFDVIWGSLASHPDWPDQEIAFVADEAFTSWGETIRVVGDEPVLGTWGLTGLGVALWTDGSLYPEWQPTGSVHLPIGTTFEYKLVAEQGGSFRWEAGDNRKALASPAAFTGEDRLELHATFR